MKHIITGGVGFIGYHMARRLAEAGEAVILVDNLARGQLDEEVGRILERPNVELLEADLEDRSALESFPEDVARVYHLAAVVGVRNVLDQPDRVLRVNARTVLNVLEWFEASDAEAFFFSSTSEAYAWTHHMFGLPIPTPEDVPLALDHVSNRRASYAASKIFGEMAVVHTCERVERRYVIARYHNVYGPRMGLAHVIPEVFKRINEGQDPLELYNPEDRRAFCHVDDAIEGSLALMDPGVRSGVYNIGNATEETTIKELAGLMLKLAGRSGAEIRALESAGPGIPRRVPDTSKLESAVGYKPAVSLHDGVRQTMEWYKRVFEEGLSTHV